MMKDQKERPGAPRMAPDDWTTADLPEMLTLAAGRLSVRKLDLFNAWCCHTLRPYLTDPRSAAAAQAAERAVDDGWPDPAVRDALFLAARQAVEELAKHVHEAAAGPADMSRRRVYAHAAQVALQAVGNDLPNRGVVSNAQFTAYAFGWANADSSGSDDLRDGHLRIQEAVFRDIVGDPFQPVAFDARWRTADVLGLARAIYEDRAFDRLPILADALMDVGCEDEAVLGHCKGPGPHARGCWVIDAVLGKE
jgi:hypothetical protein